MFDSLPIFTLHAFERAQVDHNPTLSLREKPLQKASVKLIGN